jgi:hypothetical protein
MQRADADVDLQCWASATCDVRNGLTVPPEIKIRHDLDMMTKPAGR